MEIIKVKQTLFIIALLIVGCNRVNETKQNKEEIDGFYGQLIFPDTIFSDTFYKSYIDYSYPEFDSYHLNDNHKIIRSLAFYFTIDTVRYDIGMIENKIEDSVFSSNKNKIELYKIAISTPGIKYISGYIDDEILIDSLNRDSKKGKLPGYLFRSYLTKKVVVLER
ncbi:hypothetical protein QW060_02695 [Myroides ceti]|uniref:Uncharacterized protein n=1 Tax=Paenimyroides ceti TaxID=395087 RepID=A0ABT8CPB0_9FLAO|nr:hypothetical protein [Paenimyroides ceti]MDN3706035.1 hypothetical protein [Paenimyroides ceti]